MFHHILVPLDGSRRAESAIPLAATIARATRGSLLLLRVVTLPTQYAMFFPEPSVVVADIPAEECLLAATYLKNQAYHLQELPVQTCVMIGMPAHQILTCIEAESIDLVVMCSRGEIGLKRWALGSVTQKVARQSKAPVLALHESAGMLSNLHPAGCRPVRALVALDGSTLAEAALKPAAVLVDILSAPEKGALHLVRVLPEPYDAREAASSARQLDLDEARVYLRMTEQALRDALEGTLELELRSSVVTQENVAETLIGLAETGLPTADGTAAKSACDLLALTTHGRSGLVRLIAGSVAERLLDETRMPLLIVHPTSHKSAQEAEALTNSVMTHIF